LRWGIIVPKANSLPEINLDLFYHLLSRPDEINISDLKEFGLRITSIIDFRFFYTLANILRRELSADDIKAIDVVIIDVLRSLALNKITTPKLCSIYKTVILASAHRKGIIDRILRGELSCIADNTQLLNDSRYQELVARVSSLEEKVQQLEFDVQENKARIEFNRKCIEVNRQNLNRVAQSLTDFKKAYATSKKRQMFCSVARFALGFVGCHVFDIIASAVDLSDAIEVGGSLINDTAETFQQIILDNKKAIVGAAADKITGAGFRPTELMDNWSKHSIALLEIETGREMHAIGQRQTVAPPQPGSYSYAGVGYQATPASPAFMEKPKLDDPICTAEALHNHNATDVDELSFRIGDVLKIFKKDDSGWWKAELNGRQGLVPGSFLRELSAPSLPSKPRGKM